ncbi:FHA domain-containing protein [Deinococcus sp. Arct2-2]|uniref:phage tail protein n=1 Tax=Deinococcus sp. Arct2-2 TaxID=2568653 RepID=UPI0010A59CB9|nr:phage tail protein [Deinococcus sp. Arct2-2]THF69547.1 FHA domain-containing protein [Deinococcus sp. Arct2-2]
MTGPEQAAPAPNGGQLSVRRGGETLRAVALEMRLLSLGRTPDNGLPLPDAGVAIRHAELARDDSGQLVLTDLGNNSTFLNGRRLQAHAPTLIEAGDEIQIGPFSLTYSADAAPAPLTVAATASTPAREELRLHPLRPARVPQRPQLLSAGASSYLGYLPALFEESDFAGRYLRIFENLWEPLQHRQDHLALYFDPRTSPPEFLNWLSGWLGLSLDDRWPEQRRREWVRESMTLYRWRGTRYGLTRALEIACGVTPALEEDGNRPHHIKVVVPEDPHETPAEQMQRRELVADIVSQHAPAHVQYQLEFVTLMPAVGASQ